MKPPSSFSRRDFFRLSSLAGGGLMLGYALPSKALGQSPAKPKALAAFAPNHFIKITSGGKITLVAKIPDMGQGIKTALPMILAEELGVHLTQVHLEYGRLNSNLGPQDSGGSMSIFDNYQPHRIAGAMARTLLISAAAESWQVPASECRAKHGMITHLPTDRTVTFGEIASHAALLPLPAEDSLVFKNPGEHTLLGTRIGGVHNRAIVAGQPLFGIDQVVPGMRHAVYVKCPVFGGKVVSANLDHIKRQPGIIDAFILTGTRDYYGLMPGIAIVGDSTWSTFRARQTLDVVWANGPGETHSSADYEQQAIQLGTQPGPPIRNDGNTTDALTTSAQTLTARYHYPYLHHAPLEPMNATAIPAPAGRMHIIAPTQAPGNARTVAAEVLQVPPDQVTVQFPLIGGSFGRRITNDFVAEVAAIAQRVNQPVKLTWTREDDTQHGQYRPAGWHFLKAGLSATGDLVAWHNHFVTVGLNQTTQAGTAAEMSDKEFPCRFVPHYRLEKSIISTNVPTSWYRAPGSNGLSFVHQSFLDELAHASGQDPLAFQLQLLGPDKVYPGTGRWDPPFDSARMKAVLRLVAEKANWGKLLPRGSGQGIAFHFSHQGYVAEIAEVTVTHTGVLSVQRVFAAVDVGPIINYSGAEAQVQGSIIDGLSSTWLQEITLTQGHVDQTNFHDLPLLRINDAPARIEVHFIQSDNPPTGLGEPALPPLPPAICNAIFAATGQRIRRLPLSRTDLSWT